MLLQLINQNKDEFLRLIQEPVDQSIVQELLQQTGGYQGENYQNQEGTRENVIDVTEEELNAIERLAELANCDKTAAAEAYLACDKNENLAANYLFEHPELLTRLQQN